MNKKNILWLRPVLFLVCFALVFSFIQPLFTVTDGRIYQTVKGFYEEKPNTLDAIYIGASNVYASWQGPMAWKEYGFTCYGLAIPAMPAIATKYLIEEARKTQPNALFIVNLNNFKSNGIAISESDIHYVTNFMPMSKTKVELINELSAHLGYTSLDKIEFYLPIIRFHSGWNQITSKTFNFELAGLKGASSYPSFLTKPTNITNEFLYTDRRNLITDEQEQVLIDLVTYCQDENVNMLFVFSPQAIESETTIEQINTMKDYVATQGFPVLDVMEEVDSLELDLTCDFYDKLHCNIHGALKFTRFLGSYLKENYNFRDKRGDPAYASWDQAAANYTNIIEPYTLDFERENALRSNDLATPNLTKCTAYGEKIQIVWEETSGASGYAIYRQYTDPATHELTHWEFIANVDANTLKFTDQQLQRNVTYKYTVVPLATKDSETIYGNFNISGISAQTNLPAPVLLSLDESEHGITVSWAALDGADGYMVYRKLPGQKWNKLATFDANTTTYTDNYYQQDLPYIYTVRAYEEINGENRSGDYNREGILRYVELPQPEPQVQLTNSGPKITWDAIKGASNYSVYVLNDDNEWHAISAHTTKTSCIDKNYVEGTLPVYKVVAEIKYDSNYYETPSNPVALAKGDN